MYQAFSDDLIVRPVGRCPSSACTLLTQCASQTASATGCWHSRGYAYTASRAWAVKRDHAHSQESAGASLLDRQTWWSRVTNVGPVRHRAIDSSELRLTTDRGGRQVGQHRSHIVAAVSSACLIADLRAAASGSQGRIVSSLSPGRPRADVGLSAVWSDLSAVSTTDQVGVFLWLEGLSVYSSRSLQICPLINLA